MMKNNSMQADLTHFTFFPTLDFICWQRLFRVDHEIVHQLLQFVIGSTAISLGVLLATFMGGLCLGSVACRGVTRWYHPLRVYAVLELGIGFCGILVFFGMPLVSRIYVTGMGHRLPAILRGRSFLRFACCRQQF